MKQILLLILLVNIQFLKAQIHYQYFDGADTNSNNSIIIKLEAGSPNIWQIGKPNKAIFDSASTAPNVIVTDTVQYIPSNNVSSFSFYTYLFSGGIYTRIIALRWKQKLDYDPSSEGGMVEYSTDKLIWKNTLNNPDVYNYYGFMPQNKDTLSSGEYVFSGTDSTWRDIWLCFRTLNMPSVDTLYFKFTSKSDGVNTNKEGWMIDNMQYYATIMHPVKEISQTDYLNVYPSITNGILNIDLKKNGADDYDIIESMELINVEGKVVEHYGESARKTMIDISNHSAGMYLMKVTTNIKSVSIPVFLEK